MENEIEAEKQRRRRTIPVLERYGWWTFCTKPRTSWRFFMWNGNGELREMGRLPCGGILLFLGEDRMAALYQMAIGRPKYDPRIDIDRYAVACPAKDLKPDVCPAWDAVRKLVSEAAGDVGADAAGKVAAGSEVNLIEDKGNGGWIFDGDGTAGPIAEDINVRTDAAKAVKEAAKKCSGGTERGDNAADENDVVFHAGIISKFIAWWKGE